MKVGEKVEHRNRPDVGIGIIVEITGFKCTVEFNGSKFSGISLDAICSVEEKIRRAKKSAIESLLKLYRFKDAEKLFEANSNDIDEHWYILLRSSCEKEAKRIEQEKLLAAERAERSRIEKERIRQKRERALARINGYFESNFLNADHLYEKQHKEIISRDEYDAVKTRYVQLWARTNTETQLDNEQSTAIASYGKHIQVIARAGSGKTTTLVNRAIFLQRHCHIPPNQLIILAFNRKAAEEIKERLEKYFGGSIPHVMTFHALAYAIVHPEEDLLYDDPASNSLAKSRSL